MSIFNIFNSGTRHTDNASLEDQFKQVMHSLNCKCERDDFDDNRRYFFDFQGGHFIAIFYKNCVGVEIIYPRFLSIDTTDVNALRMLINQANAANIVFKFTYSINEEKNDVDVSLSFFVNSFNDSQLQALLEQCFMEQRRFSNAYQNLVENNTSDDPETDNKNKLRQRFLIKQQEFLTQHQDLQFRTDQLQQLTLLQLMTKLEDAQSLHFKSLQIVRDGQLDTVEGHDAIGSFNLSSAIIEDNEFKADHAVAIVHYNKLSEFDDIDTPEQDLIATITFKSDGSDGSTLYYRVNVTLDFYRTQSDKPAINIPDKVSHFSLLVAHDIADPKKKLQEFDYMWKDAQIKLRDNQTDELTDEQRVILYISVPSIAYCTYWGKKYYYEQRYYEALLFLEAAYQSWNKNFFNLNEKEKSAFYDICYHIGFCYCELKLYKQAYYYLDIVGDIGRIDFAMEHVNTLANASDIRIFRTIGNILNDVQEQYNLNDDDVPENITNFVSFLRRRNAYSLIEFGKLDDAEEEFKKLLNDPLSHDYALQELAYIKNLRNINDAKEVLENEADNSNDTQHDAQQNGE